MTDPEGRRSSTLDTNPLSLRWREPLVSLPLLGYMAVIFCLSHSSSPPLPTILLEFSDKLLHGAEYAVLGALWAIAFHGSRRHRFLLAWLAAVLFGLTDELHQAFVPSREASAMDLLADALGAALGAAAAVSLPSRRAGKNMKFGQKEEQFTQETR